MDEEIREIVPVQRHRPLSKDRIAWHGTAFLFESVILLAFIAFSLAVVCALFVTAHNIQQDADVRTNAMALATGSPTAGAEAFAADPAAAGDEAVAWYVFDGGEAVELGGAIEGPMYVVDRVVTSEETGAGTLYHATVTVSWDGDKAYTLEADSYVPEGRDA